MDEEAAQVSQVNDVMQQQKPAPTSVTLSSHEQLRLQVMALAALVEEQALELRGQNAELREQAEELRQLKAHTHTQEADDDDDETEAERCCLEERVCNIYSWSFETLRHPASKAGDLVVSTVLVTLFIVVQVIFAYGFGEGAELMGLQQHVPAYMELVDNSIFYTWKSWHHTPYINVATSVCATLVLALTLLTETHSLLLTCCPLLEIVLMPPPAEIVRFEAQRARQTDASPASPEHDPTHGSRRLACIAWRVIKPLLAIYYQFIWCIWGAIVPALALQGSVFAFAVSTRAIDIVLNALAIAFIFDIDEQLFEQLLSENRKRRFLKQVVQDALPLSPHRVNGTGVVITFYCWACYLIDIGLALSMYFDAIYYTSDEILEGQLHQSASRFMMLHVMARGSLLILAKAHHVVRSRETTSIVQFGKPPKVVTAAPERSDTGGALPPQEGTAAGADHSPSSRLSPLLVASAFRVRGWRVLWLLCSAIVLDGLLAFTFALLHTGILRGYFGYTGFVVDVSPAIVDCLVMYSPLFQTTQSCMSMHRQDGIIDRLTQAMESRQLASAGLDLPGGLSQIFAHAFLNRPVRDILEMFGVPPSGAQPPGPAFTILDDIFLDANSSGSASRGATRRGG